MTFKPGDFVQLKSGSWLYILSSIVYPDKKHFLMLSDHVFYALEDIVASVKTRTC